MREHAFEIKSASLLTIDEMNEFVFNNLRKPSKKQPEMATNVSRFFSQYKELYQVFLKTMAYTLLFEDHKNVWIFQKCLHSTIVMCEVGQQNGGGVKTSY